MGYSSSFFCYVKKIVPYREINPPAPPEGILSELCYPSAPFSPLIRCRLSLRQLFAPFISISEISNRQGYKGSRAKGNRPGEAEAHADGAVDGPGAEAPVRPAAPSIDGPAAAA
jgi:hypothetical protein